MDDMQTLRQMTEVLPGAAQLVTLLGLDMDSPVRCYTHQSIAGTEDGTMVAVDKVNTSGLVSMQWEEMDELWLDGKVLWNVSSCRYYTEALAVVGGVVKHYTMDNDGNNLLPFNKAVQPRCKLCDDNAHTLVTEATADDVWCEPA